MLSAHCVAQALEQLGLKRALLRDFEMLRKVCNAPAEFEQFLEMAVKQPGTTAMAAGDNNEVVVHVEPSQADGPELLGALQSPGGGAPGRQLSPGAGAGAGAQPMDADGQASPSDLGQEAGGGAAEDQDENEEVQHAQEEAGPATGAGKKTGGRGKNGSKGKAKPGSTKKVEIKISQDLCRLLLNKLKEFRATSQQGQGQGAAGSDGAGPSRNGGALPGQGPANEDVGPAGVKGWGLLPKLVFVKSLLEECEEAGEKLVSRTQPVSAVSEAQTCWKPIYHPCSLHFCNPNKTALTQVTLTLFNSLGCPQVLYSQSLPVLDMMESLLKQGFGLQCDATYFRIDGSTAAAKRSDKIGKFNAEDGFRVSSAVVRCFTVHITGMHRDIPYAPYHSMLV